METLHYMMHLTPFYVTLFWGLVFLFQAARPNQARFMLGIFMLTASVIYFSHAVFFDNSKLLYVKIDALYVWAALSVFPLYYLYIRLMTRDTRFKADYLWHFLPAFVLAGLLQYTLVHASEGEKLVYMQTLMQRQLPVAGTTTFTRFMAGIYFSSRILFGLQAIAYTFSGLSLIRKYNRRIADFYSNLTGKRLLWLELLTITFVLVSIASLAMNFLGRQYFIRHQQSLAIPSLLFGSLFFIIGFLGNKQKHGIAGLVKEEEEDKIFPESKKDRSYLKEQLLILMDHEQLFLDKNLRITTLTKKLYTNRSYLSAMINEEMNMNFNDFINRYRVDFAKKLMAEEHRKGNHVSIAFLSESSGFGSESSFLRAFKQFEKTTVSRFLKGFS